MTHDAITVGPARPDEYAALGAATAAGFLAVDPGMRAEYLGQMADIGRRAAEPGVVVLAARLGGRPVGSATLRIHVGGDAPAEDAEPWSGPGTAMLRMVGVAPQAWGRGAGRALLEAALAEARRRGCRRMALFTQPVMTAARGLYGSAGFTRRPDWDHTIPVPGGPDVLGYELALGGAPRGPVHDLPRSLPADEWPGCSAVKVPVTRVSAAALARHDEGAARHDAGPPLDGVVASPD